MSGCNHSLHQPQFTSAQNLADAKLAREQKYVNLKRTLPPTTCDDRQRLGLRLKDVAGTQLELGDEGQGEGLLRRL